MDKISLENLCKDIAAITAISNVHFLCRMEFLKFGVQSVKVRLDPFPPGNSRLFIFVYLEGLYVPDFSSFCLRCVFNMLKVRQALTDAFSLEFSTGCSEKG